MKEVDLKEYCPFWGLYFGIHLIIGILAAIAGMIVIITMSEIISGLALIGAGAFAIINGWQGFQQLAKDKANTLEVNCKEDSR